jgi:hypothetical protein
MDWIKSSGVEFAGGFAEMKFGFDTWNLPVKCVFLPKAAHQRLNYGDAATPGNCKQICRLPNSRVDQRATPKHKICAREAQLKINNNNGWPLAKSDASRSKPLISILLVWQYIFNHGISLA